MLYQKSLNVYLRQDPCSSGATHHDHVWRVAERPECLIDYSGSHIERNARGKWQANWGGYGNTSSLWGPEFDTPEECAQWLTMMEAAQ